MYRNTFSFKFVLFLVLGGFLLFQAGMIVGYLLHKGEAPQPIRNAAVLPSNDLGQSGAALNVDLQQGEKTEVICSTSLEILEQLDRVYTMRCGDVLKGTVPLGTSNAQDLAKSHEMIMRSTLNYGETMTVHCDIGGLQAMFGLDKTLVLWCGNARN